MPKVDFAHFVPSLFSTSLPNHRGIRPTTHVVVPFGPSSTAALGVPSPMWFEGIAPAPRSHRPGIQGPGYDEALRQYEGYKNRDSFAKQGKGIAILARTGDPRAIDVLRFAYENPILPKTPNNDDERDVTERQVRYFIATMAAEHLLIPHRDETARTQTAKAFAAWRENNRSPEDAWLWYLSLRSPHSGVSAAQLLELAQQQKGTKKLPLKMACLHALLRRDDVGDLSGDIADLIEAGFKRLPSNKDERALFVEWVAAVAAKYDSRLGKEPWLGIAKGLVDIAFADKKTLHRTKVVTSRYLEKVFKLAPMTGGLQASTWHSRLELLAQIGLPQSNSAKKSGETVAGYYGINTLGQRIVFVVDFSDSMLEPSKHAPVNLGPVTGKRTKEEKLAYFTKGDLGPGNVPTRFGLARRELRKAIGMLSDDQSFAIVYVGTKASLCEATPGIVKASNGRKRAALKALDAIEPGPVVPNVRPHGTLHGGTNFHGGIRMAFRLSDRGVRDENEFADTGFLRKGADAILVLSDGEPSTDDWLCPDAREEGDVAGDPESKATTEGTPTLIYDGPYGQAGGRLSNPGFATLIADVERMNLFRQAEIHCVGLGKAHTGLLSSIAEIGMGQFVRSE